MKPLLLALVPLPEPAARADFTARFELVDALDAATRAAAIADRGAAIAAVLTNGTIGWRADEIAACPALGWIHVLGVGHENVDLAAAAARGIAVSNGAGTNDDAVADHALALLLAAVRRLPQLDRACRAGVWRTALPVPPAVSKRRLGILGLGAIGRKIAQRGAAFELEIGYCTRHRRDDTAWRWFETPAALAAWCDFLVVATPGGAGTRHLVDAAVLEALGADGWLVNIARGSVVDTAALADALRLGRIAGAALDVYEGEPAPPAGLFDFENVLLTPHVAGWSPASQRAMHDRVIANADAWLGGRPLVTPI